MEEKKTKTQKTEKKGNASNIVVTIVTVCAAVLVAGLVLLNVKNF